MAKMEVASMEAQVATKIAEMVSALDTLLKNPNVSENTKKTQKFQRTTQIHNLKVLHAVLSQHKEPIDFSMDEEKWFKSMVTPSEERRTTKIEVHKGDSVVDLAFNKYKDVKDIVAKIQAACDKAGLKIVDGIIQ